MKALQRSLLLADVLRQRQAQLAEHAEHTSAARQADSAFVDQQRQHMQVGCLVPCISYMPSCLAALALLRQHSPDLAVTVVMAVSKVSIGGALEGFQMLCAS